MLRGTAVMRLATDLPESAVVQKFRQTLAVLGRVEIDRMGVIWIEPGERFQSALTATTMDGILRRRGNEYEVRIRYSCQPSRLGWATVFAPLVAKWAVERAVRQALRDAEGALPGAPVRPPKGSVGERLI